MDSPQDFGVAAGHAGSNASLEGLEVGQDGWGLQHSQQEAENLQSSADVGDVSLCCLLLKGQRREEKSETRRQTNKKRVYMGSKSKSFLFFGSTATT